MKGDAFADLIKLDAVKLSHIVELIPGAAELAIGGELQADVLLFLDRLFDLAVFDCAQRLSRNLVTRALDPRLFQRRRPQQAADLFGAEWRRGSLHAFLPKGHAPPCCLSCW